MVALLASSTLGPSSIKAVREEEGRKSHVVSAGLGEDIFLRFGWDLVGHDGTLRLALNIKCT